MKPLCSVVFSTYNRSPLLTRSVEGYNRSRFPLDRLEVVVVDDGSTDDTAAVCERFDPRIDVKYVRLRKPDGVWRDCASNINVGIRAAAGAVVLGTHPEVIPGRLTLQACCDAAGPDVYSCAKSYYLTPDEQDGIDSVPWREEGNLAVRRLPGFYGRPVPPDYPVDYTPAGIDAARVWESWVFGGHDRATWRKLGGFIETQRWGSCDLIFHKRRHLLGIRNHTCLDPETVCVHQWHPAPRDLGAAHAEAAAVGLTAVTAGHPHVSHLWD